MKFIVKKNKGFPVFMSRLTITSLLFIVLVSGISEM